MKDKTSKKDEPRPLNKHGVSCRLEILKASYWEHFKAAKDLSLYLELNHPKRKQLEIEMNKMLSVINGS